MKRNLLFSLTLMSCLLVSAQTPKTSSSTAQQASANVPAPTAQLTEVERLKIENLQLKFGALQTQQQQLQSEYQALIQALTVSHPGYSWNPQTNTLVAIPKSAPVAEKK